MSIISNFFLCLKYPFLKMHNVFTDKFIGYNSTWYDCIYDGWRKAFGKQFLKELREVLKKEHCLHKFRFVDIKEKYGSLRLESSFTNDNIDRVLRKYELLSICYCEECGKKAEFVTDGWISYLCRDCLEKYYKPSEVSFDRFKLTSKDIPKMYRYVDGKEIEIDIKKEYGIDFEEMYKSE